MYLSRSIVIVLLVTSLTACGFSLRGSTYLPSPLISMQLLADDLNSRQKNELRQQLIQAGANLIDNPAGDAISLKVAIKVLPERNLADTAGSGKAIIRLFRELSYSLSTATGELLIDQKTILRQLDIDQQVSRPAVLVYVKEPIYPRH